MFEKAKILFSKFRMENLVKSNYESQSDRITKGKIASLQGAIYSDSNKESLVKETAISKKKTNNKKISVKKD